MNKEIINEEVLIELVEELIGDTGFYGCSNRDSKSLDNMDRIDIILDSLFSNLANKIMYHKDDYRASGKALSDKAVSMFKEYKKLIDESLDSLKE